MWYHQLNKKIKQRHLERQGHNPEELHHRDGSGPSSHSASYIHDGHRGTGRLIYGNASQRERVAPVRFRTKDDLRNYQGHANAVLLFGGAALLCGATMTLIGFVDTQKPEKFKAPLRLVGVSTLCVGVFCIICGGCFYSAASLHDYLQERAFKQARKAASLIPTSTGDADESSKDRVVEQEVAQPHTTHSNHNELTQPAASIDGRSKKRSRAKHGKAREDHEEDLDSEVDVSERKRQGKVAEGDRKENKLTKKRTVDVALQTDYTFSVDDPRWEIGVRSDMAAQDAYAEVTGTHHGESKAAISEDESSLAVSSVVEDVKVGGDILPPIHKTKKALNGVHRYPPDADSGDSVGVHQLKKMSPPNMVEYSPPTKRKYPKHRTTNISTIAN